MRRKMVAANWKMYGTCVEATTLVNNIKQKLDRQMEHRDIVLFPSFVHLQLVANLLRDTEIALGGQNFYPAESGAFTGEVSPRMLVDCGCSYALVGHSERRTLFGEDLNQVSLKFETALQYDLQPVLCVGETLAQYEQGETRVILQEQLASVIETVGKEQFSKAIIAYEPVWAIGTGLTATPLQVQDVHEFIRTELATYQTSAETIRILYGGSVKADNAASLLKMPDVDGVLVGGASLNADSFMAICRASLLLVDE